VILVFAGVSGWYYLFREDYTQFASADAHFKYGSIGTEEPIGIPYWIWLVLPRIFPDKLPGPGGYTSLGMVWEEGEEMPIGFTKRTIGIPRVGVNCAVCHTTSVRSAADQKPMFFPGGPSHQFDIQAYQRFFIESAKDPRFTADRILKEITPLYNLSFVERLFYRYLIIPFTKRGMLDQEQQFSWMTLRPNWGPGRTDMNPFKLMVLRLKDDGSVGNTDMMAIWNQRAHEGFLRHTDGLNSTVIEATISAALAAGATSDSVDIPSLRRVNDWLMDLPVPKYPFAINSDLATRGKSVFDANCASCHAFGSARVGKLVPMTEVGTDRNRADHWTEEAASQFNTQLDRYEWGFDNFRGKTGGYVALSLDGVWARAPYLHNGSVPSLQDLLEPADNRPKSFYRGNDIYDQTRVGFVSEAPQRGGRTFFKYDTSQPGNSNAGHLYGTMLTRDEKTALIEYLKTQ
jgi:mono/diheme cytochrome c family protein